MARQFLFGLGGVFWSFIKTFARDGLLCIKCDNYVSYALRGGISLGHLLVVRSSPLLHALSHLGLASQPLLPPPPPPLSLRPPYGVT